MSSITSIRELKAMAKASGSHFFDKDTMRFFNSRIVPNSIVNLPESTIGYFVTSEQFDDAPREYSVRVFDTSEPLVGIATVSVHATEDQARSAARLYADPTK